jgi:cytochrome c oxidase cbb3-type subunit 3
VCILFSVVYVWRYHVSKSAPLQIEEYLAVEAKAKAEKEAFLKTQASSIDENTVTLLTGADVEAGKKVFSSNCIACHGSDGQGGSVGPNLADAYWIHGGDLPSVFKSIKYGWEEKGMRAWSDDLTPLQIAQVSSYLHSIQGKSFPNPKEAQGELYTTGATTEATKDSTNTSTKDTTVTP